MNLHEEQSRMEVFTDIGYMQVSKIADKNTLWKSSVNKMIATYF